MPLLLPEPATEPLAHSPLKLVVCQVRFEESPAASDPRVALDFFERLGGRSGHYPVFEQLAGEQVEIRLGPGLPPSTQKTPMNGWRAQSDDRNWAVALLPGSMSLETKAYESWSTDFLPRMDQVLDAVGNTIHPTLQLRVGLRYVDVITRTGINSPQDWRGWIAESLLGPILHPLVGVGVTATQQQVELSLGDGIKCTLRHGTVHAEPAGPPAYLLDWDVYVEEVRAYDAVHVRDRLIRFNRFAVQLFQQAVTSAMLDALRGA